MKDLHKGTNRMINKRKQGETTNEGVVEVRTTKNRRVLKDNSDNDVNKTDNIVDGMCYLISIFN
ncbi:hypothetical protein Hanom_Chr14g01255891 [Helianthus anomalus]